MKTPLLPIQILSVYKSSAGQRAYLPSRMAMCTPDTNAAILGIKAEVERRGGQLFLSDLFRSYDMQLQANLDYRSGKKSAYSPPPGGSMHEAGRAFDIDLSSIKISLEVFWDIAGKLGVTPIIKRPDASLKEAWHFDCRGSHGRVYDYYAAGKGSNLTPYAAMAASGILATGSPHDKFAGKERAASIQFLLVRMGHDIGNVDGLVGQKTLAALAKAGAPANDLDAALLSLEHLAQTSFPGEFRMSHPDADMPEPPDHVVS
jgi:hypothetical protein